MLDGDQVVELATDLTVAWLRNANTRIGADHVPAVLGSIAYALSQLSSDPVVEPNAEVFEPAVSVRKSLASKDHIVSLIDGRSYKSLRRHLAQHGLTPDQYRERYKLKSDYPMVAVGYSEKRRALAKELGLGRKSAAPNPQRQAVAATAAPPERTSTKRAKSRKQVA